MAEKYVPSPEEGLIGKGERVVEAGNKKQEGGDVEKKEVAVDLFFNRFLEWERWTQDSVDHGQEKLAIAEKKPWGARQNPNLLLGDDGRVYSHFSGRWNEETKTYEEKEDWFEMVRTSNEPFAPYEQVKRFSAEREKAEIGDGSVKSVIKPDGTKLSFPKRSWGEYYGEDFGWEVKSGREAHIGQSEVENLKDHIERSLLGLFFAKNIMEQREEIKSWMNEYAQKQGESRRNDNADRNDWNSLIERFAKNFKGAHLPDPSGIQVKLHETLDMLAVGEKIREYAY